MGRSAFFEVKNIGDFASAEVVQAMSCYTAACRPVIEVIQKPEQ